MPKETALIKKDESHLLQLSNERDQLNERVKELNQELSEIPANFGKKKNLALMIAGTVLYLSTPVMQSSWLLFFSAIATVSGISILDSDRGKDRKRARLKAEETAAVLRLDELNEEELNIRFRLLEAKLEQEDK